MAAGRPDNQLRSNAYLLARSAATPTNIPPVSVSGILANPPIAAAAKACTTVNVSSMESSPTSGVMSTPERAANVEPTIQAVRRTRFGFVPRIANRSGSSTTARIATPARDHRKKE
jgi:hypothetical protein